MTDLSAWEQQLQDDLAEIRHRNQQLIKASATVRARGEVRGVTVEIDVRGEITDLQIAPAAMRWPSSQLSQAIIDSYRKARADAKTKAEQLIRKTDPRIREQLLQTRQTSADLEPERRPKTEAEIQAADDAYYEQMNRRGWR
ncbi:YbaB/EbfC family nucleoid-associated protein [Nocardia terpenica]|uniref:YbaB/EbfC family DNA-binding protein n=1 Tax=Nocardia terpenica TaxID=455432 RepID=A0A164ID32_9NOCA|nr:YbaB/EbfC family nucleoid-associated protein [Nocardia terpenica]KZM69325.1 hypothetical protein AWN90_11820 [Nocardia terpenica]NQE88496.1 YbaB/EbfC family nucleoid-associated protein [Nocardia terpenica]